MPDTDKISITLEVIPGEKRYPVTINPADEELIRKAAQQLKQKFIQYKQAYSGAELSDKDIIAMVAIEIATHCLQLEKKNDTALFTSKITALNHELKEYLKEQ